MLRKDDNLSISMMGIVAILLCIFVGKSIAVLPSFIPIIIVVSIFVFFLAFAYTDLAMIFLVYAMLLSPEIGLGAATKQRDVVVRIEDMLIVVFSFAWLARTAIQGKLSFIKKTPINRAIAFYISAFVLSTILGMTSVRLKPLTGTFYILKYLEYFFVYYLVSGILGNKKQVRSYLKAFIITFAIVNVYACTQIGLSDRISAPFEGEPGEPNTLGGYQVLLLSIVIGLLTYMKNMRWRWPLIGLCFFTVIPFAYTLSRSSYMAIVPMYFTHIIFNKYRTRNILIGVLLCMIILAMFFFPSDIKDRIAYTFIPEENDVSVAFEIMGVKLGPSASARLWDWTRLFNYWKSRPFLGYGVTGLGFVDSQFMRNFVELGLVGFSAFIILLGSVFKHTLRIYRGAKDEMYKGLAIGFLAGHIGLIVHAITANTFVLIRIMEPYWFLAAMVMMIPELEKVQGQQNAVLREKVASPNIELLDKRKGVPRNVDLVKGIKL